MKVTEVFPSKWLKAADLSGKSHIVTIEHAVMEEIGSERKIVLYFRGKTKGVVLNKTNAGAIASQYGDDTDAWGGCEVELYPDRVQFKGELVAAIRIRCPVPVVGSDDEVPF